jgi:outer membrane protein TolC
MRILALALLLTSSVLFAADDDEHTDANALPLAVVEASLISFRQPDSLLNSQQQWLDNQQQQADSFLSAQPRLLGEVKTDQLGKDIGYQNIAVGVILPLWWPSERPLAQQSMKQLAQWQQVQLAAQRQKLRLDLYRVSEDYVGARETLHHARLAVEQTQQLLTHVEARQQAGDLSAFDRVSANADLQQRQQDLLVAEQTFREKQLAFEQLTGQTALPSIEMQPVVFSAAFERQHCASILSKQTEAEFISAQLTQAEAASSAKPELTLATEQDQIDRFSPQNTLARVSLTIPLALTAHRQQAPRQLNWELSQARAQLAQAERDLRQQWTQYQTRFSHSQLQWQQQQKLNRILDRQYTMAQAAFRAGELDLRELLRIKSAWLEGQHTAELLKYGQIFSALALKALQEDTGL